jgi:hypothetical protein
VVRNGSWLNTPIEGAQVKLIELGNEFTTNALGYYGGLAPAGEHYVEASHPSFEPDTALVTIISNELSVQNFSLTDIVAPSITNVTELTTTTDTAGPYTIAASIEDYSTVADAKLYYRINSGEWTEAEMLPLATDFSAEISGMPAGTQIDYYVWAEDGIGLTSTYPENAPDAFLTLYITELVYAYDAETLDTDWQLGVVGDDAETGAWNWMDPQGTVWNGAPVQPEDDHTETPGIYCFVTDGNAGSAAGDYDVDHGCTTLLSPIFDLSDADFAFVVYHRWFGQNGNTVDDEFEIDVSGNGGGNWVPLERVPGNDNTWRQVTHNIGTFVPLTDQIQFRFRACDLDSGGQGLVEAAIDDFSIETFTPTPADVADGSSLSLRTQLVQNKPNPFNPTTTIRFVLSNPAPARLEIHDTTGRLVRVLVDEKLSSGAHAVLWDGRDDEGRSVGSGVYFYRLKAGAFEQARRMTILK